MLNWTEAKNWTSFCDQLKMKGQMLILDAESKTISFATTTTKETIHQRRHTRFLRAESQSTPPDKTLAAEPWQCFFFFN